MNPTIKGSGQLANFSRDESKESESCNVILVEAWCQRFGEVFHRKVTELLLKAWREQLAEYPEEVLNKAFTQLERSEIGFPAIAIVSKYIQQEMGTTGRFTYADPNCRVCRGTGWQLHPAPKPELEYPYDPKWARKCACAKTGKLRHIRREYVDAVDPEGTPCVIDPMTGEYLYLARDCPQGQEFIAKLRQ